MGGKLFNRSRDNFTRAAKYWARKMRGGQGGAWGMLWGALAGLVLGLPALEAVNVVPKGALTINNMADEQVTVNDDDVNANEDWDKDDGGPLTNGKPLLRPFYLNAKGVKGGGVVTIDDSGLEVNGVVHAKLWADEEKKDPLKLNHPVHPTLGLNVTAWVEGIEHTAKIDSLELNATYKPKAEIYAGTQAVASVEFGVFQVDLDVDSNNDNGLFAGGYNDAEDKIENSPNKPGKEILETRGDVDGDGIPDFLDGLSGGSVAGLKLVPVTVELKTPIDPAQAKVEFTYNASIPRAGGGIDSTGTKIVTPGLRLWRVDGDRRSSGNDVDSGGDFIPSNKEIAWKDVAGSSTARKATLYLEYVEVQRFDTLSSKQSILVHVTHKDAPDDVIDEIMVTPINLRVKINGSERQDDDFVAVSSGVDVDLATDFSVKVSGLSGSTAELSLKNLDGDLTFKEDTLTLTSGVEAKTKLWGDAPSSAKDQTIVVVALKKNGNNVMKVEENATVFKGVKLEFDGTFVANVNMIPEGWRPSEVFIPSRTLPLPSGGYLTVPARPANPIAYAQDVQEWLGFLQFQEGDQTNKRRTWTPPPKVTIGGIETIDPKVKLEAPIEVLHGAEISVKSGFFRPGVEPPLSPRDDETIRSFEIELRERLGGEIYATGSIAVADETAHKRHPLGNLPPLVGWENEINVKAKIDADVAGAEIKSYYKAKWLNGVLRRLTFRQQWKNERISFLKAVNTKKSLAIKGLLGAQELKVSPKSYIQLDLQRYNIWYLSGQIEKGLIKTDP